MLLKMVHFQDATFRAVGTVHVIGHEYAGSGFIEFVCTNDDKIYATYTTKGISGEKQNTVCNFVGGTDGCAGIQGVLKLDFGPRLQPAKKGVGQTYSVGTAGWKNP